jgi:hypothetical protein
MAQAILNNSTLRLIFDNGIDESGKAVFKAKSYSNVEPTATADQFQTAAAAIATLSSLPLSSVERSDTSVIN